MRVSIRSFWTTGFVVASSFVLAATGCSDDDDDNGGNAGTGGSSSGSGGKAGGTGGKAGSPSGGKAGNSQAGDGNEAGTGDPGGGGAAGEMPVGGAGGEMPIGGAGGETAGGAPGEGGAGGAPTALDCAQYCDWMQASCSAGNQQYPDEAQCLQSCAAFPTAAGDNSFACRVGFASTASTDATDCAAAGPAGIGECGSPCEAYCNLMLMYCSHEADGASLNACMTECGTVPENNITTFVYPAPGGDTLACRIAHATNAAKDTDPAGTLRLLHCDHAAGDAAPCLDATP